MTKTTKLSSADVTAQIQQELTDKIVEALEAGTRPWVKGWASQGGLALRACGEAYRGINQFLLGLQAGALGYTSPFWLTYKQAQADGLQVRKGEKSTVVVFHAPLIVKDDKAPEGIKKLFLLKTYRVFNLSQLDLGEGTESIPAKYQRNALVVVDTKARDLEAEGALRSSGIRIVEKGAQAFYSPLTDMVTMPRFEDFQTTGGFLATLAHELVHATGHQDRLARDGIVKFDRFGSEQYAFEELIAELGAAMVCGMLGVAGEHIDNHAAYVGSWLKKLKGDRKAIFQAATKAGAAATWVLQNHVAGELEEHEEERLAA